jgi:uncharacterized protein (DUF362 family)
MSFDRRSFLVGGASLLAGAAAARCLPDVSGQWQDEGQALCAQGAEPKVAPGDPATLGRVLELHDASLTDGPRVNATAAGSAVSRLLLALTGKSDLKAAWSALIPGLAPGQVVGIKVNTLNSSVPTHPELVRALCDSLKQGLGLGAAEIVVWDRRLDELTRAGITADAMGVTVEGTQDNEREKGKGRGYEVGTICLGLRKTHLSNLLTRRVDHLVNFAVMKRHDASGFTGVLKNHYGSFDNPGDFHDKQGPEGAVLERRFAEAIPAVNALPEVAEKTRLWLVDATLGICKGTTESSVDCVPNKLLVGLDPVALDLRARQIRDEERGAIGPDPETISEAWLDAAVKAGLGTKTVKLEKVSL